ncbi:N-acetylglucosamine-6-sulfatase-like [Calliphora vicina]|uniref:N-acetylglucosamine-6-sulfatase-like n=1 Tax=Calliphora vicina TaxID=7373 RepID=UPI00325AA51A
MDLWLSAIVILFVFCLEQISGINGKFPNIVLILTDDQDVTLNGLLPMQNVKNLIGLMGATFENAFTTSPLCCPSRASLLSGRYQHNHRTWNNSLEGGCNGLHWHSQIEMKTLAPTLKSAGYTNFFAGKYLNQYQGAEVPAGWQEFYGLHGNSRYYNYTLRENSRNVSYSNVYLTDLLRTKVLSFLNSHRKQSPFFAMVAPPAPHAPYTPAKRHRNAFQGVHALRTPNFNIIDKDKHWLVSNGKLIPNDTLHLMDTYFQKRWESLLAVDDLVADIVHTLESKGQLENTYIIYTSDNGYHMGQFAQPFDKRQPYETDVRVPLLIRGPNIKPDIKITAATALIDIFPTILEWLALPSNPEIDGQSINAFLANAPEYDASLDRLYRRSLLVQHFGEGNLNTYKPECPWSRTDLLAECTVEADCHCQDAWNNTYSCIRHFSYHTNRLYCEFNDNEDFVEAYEVDNDPHQMQNMVRDMLPIERALYSLALVNLTKCIGSSSCSDVIL